MISLAWICFVAYQVAEDAALALADCSSQEFHERAASNDLTFAPANLKLQETHANDRQYWVVGAAQAVEIPKKMRHKMSSLKAIGYQNIQFFVGLTL